MTLTLTQLWQLEREFDLRADPDVYRCIYCHDADGGCEHCTLCTNCNDYIHGCGICRPITSGSTCSCTSCGACTKADLADYRGLCLDCQIIPRCGMCHRPHTDDREDGDICTRCDELFVPIQHTC